MLTNERYLHRGGLLFFPFFLLLLLHPAALLAHPTGNMVVIGETAYWAYIDPIDDTEHHACVMCWSPGEEPSVLLRSAYSASDFMLWTDGDLLYAIERRHRSASDVFESRLLRISGDGQTSVLWSWFEDKWRIGEGGYYVRSENELVFCRYPEVLVLKKGETPEVLFPFQSPVKRLRQTHTGLLLLLGEDSCWLVDESGKVKAEWQSLLREEPDNPPLYRNTVFETDLSGDSLVVANWGNRSFDLVPGGGTQQTIVQLEVPDAPHWLAVHPKGLLLFASSITMDGQTPKPKLILLTRDGQRQVIWADNL